MATEIEADSEPAGAVAPANPVPPGRPEHTILSILVLLLLAAGVLYLVDWSLRENRPAVQAWAFSEGVDDSVWNFPDPEAAPSPAGMTFEMPESGFGPRLDLQFPAENVRRVEVTVAATHAETGEPVPFALGWYWGRSEDVAESPENPFSTGRAMAFHRFVRHRPDSYRVNLDEHPQWHGTVEAAMLTFKFPEAATGPFRITLTRLEFLE